MQGLSVSTHVPLQTGEGTWIADTDASVVGEERLHDSSGRPFRSPSLDAASRTVPP